MCVLKHAILLTMSTSLVSDHHSAFIVNELVMSSTTGFIMLNIKNHRDSEFHLKTHLPFQLCKTSPWWVKIQRPGLP
jgi:hypothetical protein